MKRRWLVLLLVLGCRERVAGRPDRAAIEAAAATPAGATAPIAPHESATYSEDDLQRAAGNGGTLRPLEGGRVLVCGDATSPANCVCLEPPSCGPAGCATFQQRVDAFRASLAHPAKGRKVDCRRAEIGTCGAFRYFDFDGDIERHELIWFDEEGKQVAHRSFTDYFAYCGGKTRIQFVGKIPKCGPMVRQELICGAGGFPLPRPIEDVLKRRLPLDSDDVAPTRAPGDLRD